MVNAVNPSSAAAVAAASQTTAAPAPVVAPRKAAEVPAVVVRLSFEGSEAARVEAARVPLDAPVVQADLNQDGVVSDQERLTDAAHVAAQRAFLSGSSDLGQALQAYQEIASLADAQR